MQITEFNAHGMDPVKLDEQKLLAFMKGNVCILEIFTCVFDYDLCEVSILGNLSNLIKLQQRNMSLFM